MTDEQIIKYIERIDYLHSKYIFNAYHLTSDIVYTDGQFGYVGDWLKSLGRYSTTRRYEVCRSFVLGLIVVYQNNSAGKIDQYPRFFTNELTSYINSFK
jgi:hypothetical protein